MEWFKLIIDLVGKIIWPIVFLVVASYFRKEIAALLKRVKKAKYKDMEISLGEEIKEVKNEAMHAGITIAYPANSFKIHDDPNYAEAAFIKSWQKIESLLVNAYKANNPSTDRIPLVRHLLSNLEKNYDLDPRVASLIPRMYEIRNRVVHSYENEVTRGELLEWLGISKSVYDRLKATIDKKT